MRPDLAKFDGYEFLSGEEIKGLNTKVVSVEDGLIQAIEQKCDKVSGDINSLVPLYVRKSQAEEGR